jgi:hypothetical protein
LKQNDSWKTWLLVVALLIFAGVASAVVPFLLDQAGDTAKPDTERAETVITIDVEEYVIGDKLNEIGFIKKYIDGRRLTSWQAFGMLSGFTLVSIGGAGLVLALVSMLFSRQVSSVLSDEGYKAAQAKLTKRDQASVKSLMQERASSEPESGSRAYWPVVVTSSLVLLIVWVVGIVLGNSILEGATWSIANTTINVSTIVTATLLLIAGLVIVLITRQRGPGGIYGDSTDGMPVNWGIIWVIVSGMLTVGLGTGISVALQSGG